MLAIAGGKGGCGKTTTALGLARAFASAGDRTLVVDADCDMPNLHTMACVDRRPGVRALADGAPLDRVVHRSRVVPGVDVLPAGDATGPLDSAVLRRLRRVRGRVLVDCPAGATRAVADPLRAADAALVVSTPERASREDAAKTARMARALDASVPGAVLTRVPEGEGTAPSTPGVPQRGPGLLRTECEVLVAVPEVGGGDVPVFDHPVGRTSYERLAEHLDERNV